MRLAPQEKHGKEDVVSFRSHPREETASVESLLLTGLCAAERDYDAISAMLVDEIVAGNEDAAYMLTREVVASHLRAHTLQRALTFLQHVTDGLIDLEKQAEQGTEESRYCANCGAFMSESL